MVLADGRSIARKSASIDLAIRILVILILKQVDGSEGMIRCHDCILSTWTHGSHAIVITNTFFRLEDKVLTRAALDIVIVFLLFGEVVIIAFALRGLAQVFLAHFETLLLFFSRVTQLVKIREQF